MQHENKKIMVEELPKLREMPKSTQDKKNQDDGLEKSEVRVARCGVYIDEGWLRM